MPIVRCTRFVDAEASAVAAALRCSRTAESGLASVGVRGRAHGRLGTLLVPGDEITFRVGGLLPLRVRMVGADTDCVSSVLIAGPAPRLWHVTELTAHGDRTLVTETVEWTSPLGRWGRLVDALFLRRFVAKVLACRIDGVRELAEQWAVRPIVVGAVIVRGNTLLAQQRRYPAQHAGRWELPGGRVDPCEDEAGAVVRECNEELDVEVRPAGRIGTDVPLDADGGMLLRIHAAELLDPASVPTPVEHRALRWVDTSELAELDWLSADRLLVHSLRARLLGWE